MCSHLQPARVSVTSIKAQNEETSVMREVWFCAHNKHLTGLVCTVLLIVLHFRVS